MKVTDDPIVLQRNYPIPIAEVWETISSLQKMHEWYFTEIPAFEAKVGFKTQFNIEAPSQDFFHQWEVIEVEEGVKLVYKWTFENIPGASTTTWELMEVLEGTQLTLTNHVLEDFPDEIPEFTIDSCKGGWDYFLNERLADYLK
ncbi:MAG: hypothetical protein ACJA01_004085 [Saprospiraceae bacterium]|jgi:uncharacterized protein YndB with AHSA1/START domain